VGLKLPENSLGLWNNFGGTAPLERSREIVRRAFELGRTSTSRTTTARRTARAEETFGQILRKDLAGHRDEIVVSTKAGWDTWPGPYGDGAAPPRVPSRSCPA
jgi:L-glyceraldehyde 3-phosphate reductase